MGLIDNIKTALLAKRVLDRVKEAKVKGKLWSTVYGLASAAVAGVAAKITATCPELLPNLGAIAGGAVVAGIALWLSKPKQDAGIKATAFGIVTAIVTAFATKVSGTCPGLVENIGAILTMGASAGLGLYLSSPKDAPKA